MDEEHVVSARYEERKSNSSNNGLLAVIFVLLIMLVGGGAFIYGTNQSGGNTNEPTTTPTPSVTVIPTEVLGDETEATPSVIPQKVLGASVTVNPQNSTTCPTTFEFSGQIKVDAPGIVKYRWIKSDGTTPIENQEEFIIAGTKTVSTNWKVFGSYSGWIRLETISPNVISSTNAQFKLTCPTVTPSLNIKPLITPNIKIQITDTP